MKHQIRSIGYIGLFTLLFFLLTACAGAGREGGTTTTTPSSNATEVQIKVAEFSINSSVTSFTPGKSYHFVITNNGKTAHEFMIMPKSEGSMGGMQMGDMDKMALASIDNIAPGETKTLDYTFPSSAANSSPEFACYLPGHYEGGMKEDVKVSAS